MEGYGLSETINIITVNPVYTRKYGSCGIVWPDTDLVVVDLETGTKVMPRGELGELIEHCRKQLAPYKVPKLVEFIDAVPRTSVGKPDRKVLQQREAEKNRNA